jgi:predicted DNA-binding transcriptional regulator AlpA
MSITPPPAPQIEPLLSEDEVARIFGVTGQTISNWAKRGILPRVKIGAHNAAVRYRRSDVQALIDRQGT